MLKLDDAKRIVHGPKLSKLEQLLALLAIEPASAIPVQELKRRCEVVGLPALAKKNISSILGTSKGMAARTPSGWELQEHGVVAVKKLADAANINLVIVHSSRSLRSHAESISDSLTKSFAMEAITCFEAKQYRAAVVFSWAGAVALIHRFVFFNKVDEFNAEASRRDQRWRAAKQTDDLGRMSEKDLLDICEHIGVLGKNVKLVLQNECLMLRNSCGHPNTLVIAENSVAAHIEKLINNVYTRF